MNAMHILLVEDDTKVAKALSTGLKEAGFEVTSAPTGKEALSALTKTRFELVVLDLGLPDCDGLEVLKAIRETLPRPAVMIVTARDLVADRVKGLDLGADDYLVKPFAFTELLARIRALLRRSGSGENLLLRVGDLEIDLVARSARRGSATLDLRPREFDLLVYLARHAGQAVSRDALGRDVWKVVSPAVPMNNVIDVHISHLREKLDHGREKSMLKTLRGIGFMLESDQT